MTECNGKIDIGFFTKDPYETDIPDDISTYGKIKSAKIKDIFLQRAKKLETWTTSGVLIDIFTGKPLPFQPGIKMDGIYVFPIEYVYYVEKYDIGIPEEYISYIAKEEM